MKQRFFRFLAFIVGITLSFAFAEAFLRILQIGYGNAPLESDPILHHRHPSNYTYRVHTPDHEYGGHYVRYDSGGNTVSTHNAVRKSGTPQYRIAFLGDSFVEATQVSYEKSFVGLLDEFGGGNYEVRNYGVSSYCPVLYWLQWKKSVKSFRPTHVFVLLYSNDIEGDREYASQAVSNGEGWLAVPGSGNDGVRRMLRKSYLVRLMRKVQLQIAWLINKNPGPIEGVVGGYIETASDIHFFTEKALLKLNKDIAGSGAELILSAVPSKYRLVHGNDPNQQMQFSDKVKAWSKSNGIEFLDLVPPFEKAAKEYPLFFERDIHFNERGHRVIFNTIKSAFPSAQNQRKL